MSILIAFEGIPASGKSTVIKEVLTELNKSGTKATMAEFKGAGNAPQIKALFDSTEGVSRTLLFWLMRLEQVKKTQELLLQYDVVIVDRYVASLIAFDGFDSEPVPEVVINWISEYFPKPDITFLLRVTLEVACQRMKKNGGGLDLRSAILADTKFVERAEERYKRLSQDPSWITIDANQKVSEVVAECMMTFTQMLKLR